MPASQLTVIVRELLCLSIHLFLCLISFVCSDFLVVESGVCKHIFDQHHLKIF